MHNFPSTRQACLMMSPRARAIAAAVLEKSEQPILTALSRDLLLTNAIEDASMATHRQELLTEHRASMDAIESKLPPIPRWADISEASGLESQADENN